MQNQCDGPAPRFALEDNPHETARDRLAILGSALPTGPVWRSSQGCGRQRDWSLGQGGRTGEKRSGETWERRKPRGWLKDGVNLLGPGDRGLRVSQALPLKREGPFGAGSKRLDIAGVKPGEAGG